MRIILIPSLLLCVLSIGFPVETILGNLSYTALVRLGMDVSMTPITFDMSMMSDKNGHFVYEKAFQTKLFFSDHETAIIDSEDLHFYLHKVPMNLYYEFLGNGGVLPETRKFLCHAFQSTSEKAVVAFMLEIKRTDQIVRGFNELQDCH